MKVNEQKDKYNISLRPHEKVVLDHREWNNWYFFIICSIDPKESTRSNHKYNNYIAVCHESEVMNFFMTDGENYHLREPLGEMPETFSIDALTWSSGIREAGSKMRSMIIMHDARKGAKSSNNNHINHRAAAIRKKANKMTNFHLGLAARVCDLYSTYVRELPNFLKCPLKHFKFRPITHMPEDFRELWDHDPLFRCEVRQTIRTRAMVLGKKHYGIWSINPPPIEERPIEWQEAYGFEGEYSDCQKQWLWPELKEYSLLRLGKRMRSMCKPLKRRVIEGKTSYVAAVEMASYTKKRQQEILNEFPAYALRSTAKFRAYNYAMIVLSNIRESVNTAKCINKKTPDVIKFLDKSRDIGRLIHQAKAIGITPPTSLKGMKVFYKIVHDQNHPLYTAIRDSRQKFHYVVDGELPPLPPIRDEKGNTAKITLIDRYEDYAKEGQEMQHCFSTYTGTVAIHLHIECGESRATLSAFRDDNQSHLNQVQGLQNRQNWFTHKVRSLWMPILAKHARNAEFTKYEEEPVNMVDIKFE